MFTKKMICGVSALILAFGSFSAGTAAPVLFSGITAQAASKSINVSEITLYALDEDSYEGKLIIPSDLPQSFKIKVDGASKVTYSYDSEEISVSSNGVVSPYFSTMYWKGGFGQSVKPNDMTGVTVQKEYSIGTFTVTVNADDEIFPVKVTVKDYSDVYVENVVDDYISKNITDSMSTAEKLDKVGAFIAGYDYSPYYQSIKGYVFYGGGDCWASANTAIYFAEKLGFQGWSYNSDPYNYWHRDALIYDGSDLYDVSAGYSGNAPRYYSVSKHTGEVTVTKEPTCTEKGTIKIECPELDISGEAEVSAKGHTYTGTTVAATSTAQGYTLHTCSVCGDSYKDNYTSKLIPEIVKVNISEASAKFSATSITYTGKAKMPKLTVTYNGKTLVKGTDYTVTVSNSKKVGKATATIKGKGDYTGTKKLTYYVVPVKPTINKVTSTAKKKLTVQWKKNTTATGYQIQVAANKTFTVNKKSYGVSKNSTVKATISKLTSGKKYYVRMRCYKTIDGVKKYSAYSAVKSVKVK